jgi:hypothetical protein
MSSVLKNNVRGMGNPNDQDMSVRFEGRYETRANFGILPTAPTMSRKGHGLGSRYDDWPASRKKF